MELPKKPFSVKMIISGREFTLGASEDFCECCFLKRMEASMNSAKIESIEFCEAKEGFFEGEKEHTILCIPNEHE